MRRNKNHQKNTWVYHLLPDSAKRLRVFQLITTSSVSFSAGDAGVNQLMVQQLTKQIAQFIKPWLLYGLNHANSSGNFATAIFIRIPVAKPIAMVINAAVPFVRFENKPSKNTAAKGGAKKAYMVAM